MFSFSILGFILLKVYKQKYIKAERYKMHLLECHSETTMLSSFWNPNDLNVLKYNVATSKIYHVNNHLPKATLQPRTLQSFNWYLCKKVFLVFLCFRCSLCFQRDKYGRLETKVTQGNSYIWKYSESNNLEGVAA